MARWFGLFGKRETTEKAVSPVSASGSGWFSIFESFPGAWQRNVTVNYNSVMAFHAVFACQSLIASDIAKLPIMLVQKDQNGVWNEITNPAYSPVLRKPNHFQTWKQFVESWVISKLQTGNTYVLKERDLRGVVVALYVLDPKRVTVLVSDDGSVFYELQQDNLSSVPGGSVRVPAREIIHDRFNPIWHPLVGVSPLFAAGLAATAGLSIQEDAALFFQNGARPGGIISAPGAIGDDTAQRIKEYWTTNYTGSNAGKVAVLGDGMKYEAIRQKASDAQLVEQLKWSAEVVCSVYHVPPYMVGVGQRPAYDNVQSAKLDYFQQCLQTLIKDIVDLLDDGLGLDGVTIGVEIDIEDLMRMDMQSQMEVLEKSKGKLTVNEMRRKLNRGPVTGGDTVYLQEQDHSLEWLAKRDALPIEAPEPAAAPPAADNDNEMTVQAGKAMIAILKGLR